MKPLWFDIPAGTRVSQCRSCKAEAYWITTPADRKMLVDCDVEGGFDPSATEDGRGVSHFAQCPDAEHWRKP